MTRTHLTLLHEHMQGVAKFSWRFHQNPSETPPLVHLLVVYLALAAYLALLEIRGRQRRYNQLWSHNNKKVVDILRERLGWIHNTYFRTPSGSMSRSILISPFSKSCTNNFQFLSRKTKTPWIQNAKLPRIAPRSLSLSANKTWI